MRWARQAWLPVALGLALISLATPWVSPTVFERWFAFPQLIALSAIPLMSVICLVATLAVMLIGCAIMVPAIAMYTLYAYRVFWGKARALDSA